MVVVCLMRFFLVLVSRVWLFWCVFVSWRWWILLSILVSRLLSICNVLCRLLLNLVSVKWILSICFMFWLMLMWCRWCLSSLVCCWLILSSISRLMLCVVLVRVR